MAFHNEIAPFAIAYGKEARVLPALMVAQAILESNNGTSELAVKAKNLFGIKKGTNWFGPTYSKSSAEFFNGVWSYPVSEFRVFDSFEDSFANLAAFYQKPRYAAVLGETDFLAAATAAWSAGYATDPTYPQKLYNIYTTYNLQNLEGELMTDIIISTSAGHAGYNVTPGKRGPDGKVEWIWNNKVLLAFASYMAKTFENVKVIRVDDPTGRTDVPLSVRAARANRAGAKAHIDFHHNAMSAAWFDGPGGIETFIMTPRSANPNSYRLAQEVHPRIVKAMGLRDRGIKSANFAMLRETNMAAILTEGGFMDSRVDRRAMDNNRLITAQGEAAAEGAGIYLKAKRREIVTQVSKPTIDYIGEGDSGPAVVDAQTDLVALGYSLTIDGSFGPKMLAVVKEFQSDNKLQVDGFYGPGSRAAAEKLLAALIVLPDKLFRVRESWGNVSSQLGAYGELEGAKEVADLNPGYEVYDDDGKVVYPIVKPAPKPSQKWYRVRDDWSDVIGQKAAFPQPDGLSGAKGIADKFIKEGYKVFDDSGKVVYDPAKEAAVVAAEKAKAEAAAKAAAEKAKAEAAAKAAAEALRLEKEQYEKDYQAGVRLGITDGSAPKEAASREDVVVMLVRALKLK